MPPSQDRRSERLQHLFIETNPKSSYNEVTRKNESNVSKGLNITAVKSKTITVNKKVIMS